MRVTWNQTTRDDWDAFGARHGASLQQSWAYGEAMRGLGVQVHRACIEDAGQVLGLAQFICRRIAGYLSLASCSRGPVWPPEVDGAQRAQAYRLLKQGMPTRALRVSLLSPDTDAPATGELARLSRVMTGYSTVMLDLRQDLAALRAQLDGKWRNRLVKAEEHAELRVQVQADRPGCEQLLRREDEQRASRGFHGLPTQLVPAYIAAHDKPSQAFVLASARLGKETVAAMLFLMHGSRATYHMGWADEPGRRLNTHNLLLWRAVEHFHGLGFAHLDLGGVNTHDLPGISRFKLGTGGQVLTLAGTYF